MALNSAAPFSIPSVGGARRREPPSLLAARKVGPRPRADGGVLCRLVTGGQQASGGATRVPPRRRELKGH